MNRVLDIVALRSLTSIADSGGFRRAADSLHLSQSAVSQHIRRLEQACGRPLVKRAGRGAQFTAEGELMIAEARKILAAHDDALLRLNVTATPRHSFVIGSTEHAAELLLPAVTDRLHAAFPGCAVRYRIDRGKQLNDRVDEGAIDASLFIGDVRGRDAQPAGALPLAWFASPGWQGTRNPHDPVELIVIDGPCTLRRRALQTLAENHRDSSIVVEAGHLAGVISAARAGMGLALLAHLGQGPPEGLVRLDDLPAVAPEPLHVRGRPGVSMTLVAAIVASARDLVESEVTAA